MFMLGVYDYMTREVHAPRSNGDREQFFHDETRSCFTLVMHRRQPNAFSSRYTIRFQMYCSIYGTYAVTFVRDTVMPNGYEFGPPTIDKVYVRNMEEFCGYWAMHGPRDRQRAL